MTPVSLISGGSRGLGLAIVESLLARGDRVATFSRSGSPALSALAAAHPDQLHIDQLDAADSPAIQAFVSRVAARFGRIDHCIANAAIAHEGVLATMRDDQIDSMLDVNVKGSIVFVRECVRQMLMGDSAGRTVTLISSVVAERGSPGLSVYAATKAALETMIACYADEIEKTPIRVNLFDPGAVRTEMRFKAMPGEDQLTLPTPAEVAATLPPYFSPEFMQHGQRLVFAKRLKA